MNLTDDLPQYVLEWTQGVPLYVIAMNRHLYENSVNDWLDQMSNITPEDIEGIKNET